jgi:hypothetical protein
LYGFLYPWNRLLLEPTLEVSLGLTKTGLASIDGDLIQVPLGSLFHYFRIQHVQCRADVLEIVGGAIDYKVEVVWLPKAPIEPDSVAPNDDEADAVAAKLVQQSPLMTGKALERGNRLRMHSGEDSTTGRSGDAA